MKYENESKNSSVFTEKSNELGNTKKNSNTELNGSIDSVQNEINESKNDINELKNDINGNVTGVVGDVSEEVAFKQTDNSTINSISAEDIVLIKDSRTNGGIVIETSDNSGTTSSLSSLSVSPTNSLVDYIDNVPHSSSNNEFQPISSSETTNCQDNGEALSEKKAFTFSSPSKIKEFVPKFFNPNELLSVATNLYGNSSAENLLEASASTSLVDSVNSGLAPSGEQEFISGRGQDLSTEEKEEIYRFELCRAAVGRLIGKGGRFVKSIRQRVGAVVIVDDHPCSPADSLCNIYGTRQQVSDALEMIVERFPQDEYRGFSVERFIFPPPHVQIFGSFRLTIPPVTICEVQVCKVITPGRFFVHMPTHPSYHNMYLKLNKMNAFYSERSPKLENPCVGNICVVKSHDGWCRAEVMQLFPDTEVCVVRLCDFGGYEYVGLSSLYMIHSQFMGYPFQAIECSVAYIEPADGECWAPASIEMFEFITRGLILGFSVGKLEGDIHILRLEKMVNHEVQNINQQLLDYGYARLIPPPELIPQPEMHENL